MLCSFPRKSSFCCLFACRKNMRIYPTCTNILYTTQRNNEVFLDFGFLYTTSSIDYTNSTHDSFAPEPHIYQSQEVVIVKCYSAWQKFCTLLRCIQLNYCYLAKSKGFATFLMLLPMIYVLQITIFFFGYVAHTYMDKPPLISFPFCFIHTFSSPSAAIFCVCIKSQQQIAMTVWHECWLLLLKYEQR